MKEFSHLTRIKNLEKLKNDQFDLLIIGGGITGAGVARDAALRGLRVALVESDDFAQGTSSRSSKLVHGGIRYLENFEFHLVFEALSERAKLFKIAPHLVHPLRFMIPIFKNSRVGRFKMALGMMLYDLLALFRTPELHENLNKHETLQRIPFLREADLSGSSVYSDAYMDDDRLVHETLRSANEAGACIANYCRVIKSDLAQGKIDRIKVQDMKTSQTFFIRCKHVVSSVGPWTDLVGSSLLEDWKKILRPTKGVHLTFAKDRLNLSSAVVMGAQESNRIVFAIPRHEMLIVGTTDTDYKDNPANVSATREDIDYLLKITNEYFPTANITEKDIISSYAGVRPLVKDDSGSEGKTSREHVILSDERGFTFVAGGKYTTYRLMAEQIVDVAIKNISELKDVKSCSTTDPLNEFVFSDSLIQAQEQAKTDLEKKLVFRYGAEAFEIIKKWPALSYWQLEAHQAIQNTMCLDLVDFYSRRAPLILSLSDHGFQYLDEVCQVFAKEFGWSAEQIAYQKESVKEYVKKELNWKAK